MKISPALETQLWYALLARAIRDARLHSAVCTTRRVEPACETSCDQHVAQSPLSSFSRFLECDNRVRSYDVYIVERTPQPCDDQVPYWRHLERGNEKRCEPRGVRRHRFACNTTASLLDLMA